MTEPADPADLQTPDSDPDPGHGHSHDNDSTTDRAVHPEYRIRAVEEALVERGWIIPGAFAARLRRVARSEEITAGAVVVARAWVDPGFAEHLYADATGACASLGYGGGHGEKLIALEQTAELHNVIVCTLCSCYPTALLGPPPEWYKSDEYRARVVREPRAVLAEFGTVLPAGITIRVWDSTAEIRYVTIPRRPPGTEALSEDELRDLVTRDSLVGVRVLA